MPDPAPRPAQEAKDAAPGGRRKVRPGMVTAEKMDKTITVQVGWRKAHRLYRKTIQQRARFKVHDEKNECGVGDLVRITETRPLSKEKRWRLLELVETARERMAQQETRLKVAAHPGAEELLVIRVPEGP